MYNDITCTDVLLLKDGRKCIVHQIYDRGGAFLVEIVKESVGVKDIPIISAKEIQEIIFHQQK